MKCDAFNLRWRACLEEVKLVCISFLIAVIHHDQVGCKFFFLQCPALSTSPDSVPCDFDCTPFFSFSNLSLNLPSTSSHLKATLHFSLYHFP